MRRALAVAAVLPLLAVLPSSAAEERVYGPPFAVGPAGGDRWSTTSADPGGRLLVGRAYAVPAVIGCGSGAPYATLRVQHVAEAALEAVTVSWQEAALEPYTFLSVGVHEDGDWLTSRKVRGLAPGSGALEVEVPWPDEADAFPRTVTVDVALESSSACPSVSGGTLRLTTVAVR